MPPLRAPPCHAASPTPEQQNAPCLESLAAAPCLHGMRWRPARASEPRTALIGPEVSPRAAVRFGCKAAGVETCVAPVPFGSTAGNRHSSSRARPPSPTCRALRWMAACRLRACLSGCAVCAARRIGLTPAWPRVEARAQHIAGDTDHARRATDYNMCSEQGGTGRSPWRGRGCKPSRSDWKIRRALCRAEVPSFLRRRARAHCHPIPATCRE